MLLTWEEEEIASQLALLEANLREAAAEWHQLGQWQEGETDLLALVQAQATQVSALLATSGPIDRQVRSALLELAVIAHIQQNLLEQTTPRR